MNPIIRRLSTRRCWGCEVVFTSRGRVQPHSHLTIIGRLYYRWATRCGRP